MRRLEILAWVMIGCSVGIGIGGTFLRQRTDPLDIGDATLRWTAEKCTAETAPIVFRRVGSRKSDYYSRLPIAQTIVDNARACDGVADALIAGRYTLAVFRGELFRWDEIDPCITIAMVRQVSLPAGEDHSVGFWPECQANDFVGVDTNGNLVCIPEEQE